MRVIPSRIALQRAAYTVAALLLAYAAIGFFAVPYLVERYVPRLASEAVNGTVSVGKVDFNPFTLALEARQLAVAAPDGPPVLKVERLRTNAQVASLFRRAWSFRAVRIEGLDARIEIGADRRLNLAALLPASPSGGGADDGERPAPRIFVERLVVAGGTITYSDRSGPSPVTTTFGSIDLEVTDLSTLRDRSGQYQLAATLLDGGKLRWRGSLALAPGTDRPVASEGRLALHGAALASAWQFVPGARGTSSLRGALTLESGYRFALRNGQVALVFEDGTLSIADFFLGLSESDRPLASIELIQAADVRLDVAARELEVGDLTARSGEAAAGVDASGTLDWKRLVASDAGGSPPEPVTPWSAKIAAVHVEQIAFGYSDHSRSPPLALDVANVRADLRLAITTGGGSQGSEIGALELALGDVTIADAAADAAVARVESLVVSGGRLDTAERAVTAESIRLSGGDTTIARGAEGPEGLLRMLASPRRGALGRELEAIEREAEATGKPWRYAVARLVAERLAIAFRERGPQTELRYGATIESAMLEGLDSGASAPAKVRASVALDAGGTVDAEGTVGQRFGTAEVALNAQDVALTPLQPLIARYARLKLESGAASGSARLRYTGGERPALNVEGRATITDALATEDATGDRLVAWKALDAEGIAYALAPNRLTVREVRLDAPAAKIAISEQRDFNLARIVGGAPSRDLPGQESGARGGRGGGPKQPFDVLVERVTLRGGIVDFSDRSLALPYSTQVRAVEGTAHGLSSEASKRATLDLAGEIGEYGAARASGRVLAANPIAHTDIVVKFDNVAMPPLSPYSATFAGRKIESGRLWLDLQYAIEQGHMKGDNEIRAAGLRLGERVEAPDALDLPLDLAVALLTRPDGEINVAVPVEGEVGDPHFDYGKVVRKALANLVTRVVSAPFRVLGSLVGGERAAELRSVTFEPGDATIAPEARETLDKVAKALRERPRLRLVVHGPYDPDRDAEALRVDRVRDEVAAERDRRPASAGAPGAFSYDDADTQRALERLLRSRAGGNGLDAFAQDYAREKGKRPATVNAFGQAGDPAYYEAMHRRLVELEPLPEGALERLAGMRASAIVDYLVQSAGLDTARIGAGEIRPAQPTPDSGVLAELGIDIMPGAS